MADFVTLSCPTCGGKLQVTPDLDRFACAHCGNEHVVRRGGGIVSLAPVVEGIDKVRVGVDKTASELAIRRLKEEIADLRRRREEQTGLLQRRPEPPKAREPQDGTLLTVLFVSGILLLVVAIGASSWPLGGLGVALMISPVWVSDKTAKWRDREDARELDAYRTLCSNLVAQCTARIAELDAQIAAKTEELDEHTRTVRIR
jgi:hypothetical protein